MAHDASEVQPAGEHSTASTSTKDGQSTKQTNRGILSRIWHGIFRRGGDDFEKKLQYLSKEEASVHSRMKKRAQSWRSTARNIMVYSVVLEAVAAVYAIMTRSLILDWKMRAARVMPIFAIPCLTALIYSALASYKRIRDESDQKTLESLFAERQAKIDELKERTNYYVTQQLIQKYDPDPAAKAAATSFLASKLGADSGLRVFLGDEAKPEAPFGKSNDAEVVSCTGLRNRKSSYMSGNSMGSIVSQDTTEESPSNSVLGGPQFNSDNQMVTVKHHEGSTANNGGWVARIAAMLVGEDPSQCYALICGNCHMHNGLARKEDFPYITYYCPHCHALNSSNLQQAQPSGSSSNNISGLSPADGLDTSAFPPLEDDVVLSSTNSPEDEKPCEINQYDARAS
ncbi:uncharacterized protein At2g24330-like [Nymphaea colorata]|nr:uncharacterized protein At2g24330-like [Nymphaea colorata]XP_031494582.1 uncharacterized protein At2g24330-like [Nymphaea colorata]XP_031494591.1 uncharacterized protein At2g24330-like [Nymphaea colorata]XP_031494599.1 uncharacterized protein At2g24330-like [Nymphaea colorata]